MIRRAPTASSALMSLTLLAACVDGDLVGVARVQSVAVSAVPVFSVLPTEDELAALDLLRVRLHGAGDAPVVLEQSIDASSDDEWSFNLTVELTPGRTLSVYLETELIDADGGAPSVEWSGRTHAFEVRASFDPLELRQVDLYRGPLANLDLTGVEFGTSAVRLIEGTSSTLRWTLAGDTTGTTMYVRTLDPSVAALADGADGGALVVGRSSGTTKAVVFGGMVADTVDLTVGSIALPTLGELEATVMPQLDYVVSDLFMSAFEDATGASSIRANMTSLGSALRGLRGAEVVDSYESAKSAWRSYGRDSGSRTVDGPLLGVVELSLVLVANTLQTGLP